jgi:ABC-type glutathione transport system ATPase component
MTALLEIDELAVAFPAQGGEGLARAADGVSFEVPAGSTVGLVGESGSGKTVTALSILRLLEAPAQVTGAVRFGGKNLLELPERELRTLRGNRIAMVFQDPMTSLNPVMTVGEQIAEVVRLHEKRPRRAAWARAVEMLDTVGISSPAERARAYPHELSGGMRQRVALVRGFSLGAPLVLMDEPFAALDEITRAEMRELLARMLDRHPATVLFVTHSMAEAAYLSDRVLVMSPRPTAVVADVVIDFPRPRRDALEDTPEFAAVCAELRHHLHGAMR